jgi:hypothetical protein
MRFSSTSRIGAAVMSLALVATMTTGTGCVGKVREQADRAEQAATRAETAARRAEDAAGRTEKAAAQAEAAANRVERMFEKHMRK